MSVATRVESLKTTLERFASEGRGAVSALAEQMRGLSEEAAESALDDLARLCRISAERVEKNADGVSERVDGVVAQVEGMIEYAAACAAALGNAEELATLMPPAVLTLPDSEDEKHFLETLGMFVSHAMGSVAELEEEILSVESAEEEQKSEIVGGIRRTIHTLKAEFGVLNLLGAQRLCHEIETGIDAITEAGGAFPVDLMLECVDLLKGYVERLANDAAAELGDVGEILDRLRAAAAGEDHAASSDAPIELAVDGEFADSVGEFISEARSHLSDAEAAMLAHASVPDSEHINVTFRAFHTIKGVAGFLNLTALVDLAHVSETLLDAARSGRIELRQKEVDLVLAAGDLIVQMIAGLEGEPMPSRRQLDELSEKLAEASQGDAGGAEVAVPQSAEEASKPETSKPETPKSDPDAVAEPAADKVIEPEPPVSKAKAPAKAPPKVAKIERMVKVSTSRLDMLVDMVGELVIAQSMVLQDPTIQKLDSQALSRNISQVSKITRDLQEAAMSLRMVTVKATFQKMARLVRDVAQKSGKRVALSILGEDTELDRNVVEQISDPLVHMVRNAIDHGIESPAGRAEAGKPAEGALLLRAYHQGGSIVIEIQDDGRGIDKEAVVGKAIERGLLPEGTRSSEMSDAEAFGLVFMPGFSTADKITDLSGRGVGMDVVRRNIEALRGKIEIESKLGEGTTFRMRLPLTLAIIDGMVVQVGDQRYVVPTLSIEQSFRPSEEDIHYLTDRGECVRVRGAVLPVYRLKQVFGQDTGLDDLTEGILIVVEVDGENSCLFVDCILGQQQVVIKTLGLQGERTTGVSGGAIMSDGKVALILDVGSLVGAAVMTPCGQ